MQKGKLKYYTIMNCLLLLTNLYSKKVKENKVNFVRSAASVISLIAAWNALWMSKTYLVLVRKIFFLFEY